jgi:regulator of protease activity HflC (stomatin/prohibitin superfamily)
MMIKKNVLKIVSLILLLLVTLTSCTKVPAGYVGVKVYLLGSNKGVDHEVLGVGRYWVGINEELFKYPTYQINYVYTKDKNEGSSENEEFTFQTKEGMECSMDIGVSMHFESDKIAKMFQTYRKGEEDIRGIVVRNNLRDALNKIAGNMPVEYVYGEGKGKLVDSVQNLTKTNLNPTGIAIDKVYLIGSIRIPTSVREALDSKVKMTQEAQKAQNEVAKAEADANIAIAQANGVAQSLLIKAKAQAEANLLLTKSVSPILVQYKAVETWDGKLPQVSGGGTVPFINIK